MVLTNKQSVIAQTDSGCVWKCHKVAACVLSPLLVSLIPPQKSSGPSELSSEEIQAQTLDEKGPSYSELSLYHRPIQIEQLETAGVQCGRKFVFT